jgi:hypothetical protein
MRDDDRPPAGLELPSHDLGVVARLQLGLVDREIDRVRCVSAFLERSRKALPARG